MLTNKKLTRVSLIQSIGHTFINIFLHIWHLHASIISPPLETMLGLDMLRRPCRHSSISPVKKDCNPPGLHLSMGSPSPASPPPPPRSRAGEGGQPRRLPGEPLSSSSVFLVFAESLLSLRWNFYQSLETAIRGTVALMGL